MKPPNLRLHIEELVLEGFPSGDRYAIGEAVERELTRLFLEQGVPPSLRQTVAVDYLDGGSFGVKAGARTETIAPSVARTLYGVVK